MCGCCGGDGSLGQAWKIITEKETDLCIEILIIYPTLSGIFYKVTICTACKQSHFLLNTPPPRTSVHCLYSKICVPSWLSS